VVKKSTTQSLRELRVQIFNPLDRPDWDEQISQFTQSSFFHSSAWLRVLHETYGFEPIAIALNKADKTSAILVTMEINSWLTGKRGASLPFTDTCEPLFSDPTDLDALYESAFSIAAKRNWRTLEIRSGTGFPETQAPSLRHYTHHLGLQKDPQKIFSQFSSSNRRAIRKAERSDLEVKRSQTLESLKSFYSLLCLTRKRHGLPPQPWSFFQAIHQHILSQDEASLFIAYNQSKPIAGALFLHQGQKAIYKFGASDERSRSLRPNNLLMWKAIEWLKQQGYQHLDFGRTSLNNSGLRRFKQSWGTSEQILPYFLHNLQTQTIETQNDATNGWHTRVFQQLPIPISRIIGKILYKHVA
jgi:lipid II:glycine glycyltransferase (peptidoglycan interpeptide bridge formation enzyme)